MAPADQRIDPGGRQRPHRRPFEAISQFEEVLEHLKGPKFDIKTNYTHKFVLYLI